MKNPFAGKFDFHYLDEQFLVKQVESHLFFGPISRYIPLGYFMIAGMGALAFFRLFEAGVPLAQRMGGFVEYAIIILPLSFFAFKYMTKRQQAVMGWVATKLVLAVAAFLFMTAGAGSSYAKGKSDALPFLLLGLIWMPSLEFIPQITPHQKYITLARLILSIPCIYMGIKSGYWH